MTDALAQPGTVPAGVMLQICFELKKGLYTLSIEGLAMAADAAFRSPPGQGVLCDVGTGARQLLHA